MYPSTSDRLYELMSNGQFVSWRRPAANLVLAMFQGYGAFDDGITNHRIHPLRFPVCWHINHEQQWCRKHKCKDDCWDFNPALRCGTYRYWEVREQLAKLLPALPALPARHGGQPFTGTALKVEGVLRMHGLHTGLTEYCGLMTVHYLPEDQPEMGRCGDRKKILKLLDEPHLIAERVPIRVARLEGCYREDSDLLCYGFPYRLHREDCYHLWMESRYGPYVCPRENCRHYHNVNAQLFRRCFRQEELELATT